MSHVVKFIDAIHPAFLDGDPDAHTKPVEGANVRRLKEAYAAVGRGDFAVFAAAFAPDVELDIAGPPEPPFAGRWAGRDRVLEAIRNNFSLVEDQRPVVESVVAQGDTVVVMFEETGRVRTTGRDYRVRCAQVFTFRNGDLVRVRQVAASSPEATG